MFWPFGQSLIAHALSKRGPEQFKEHKFTVKDYVMLVKDVPRQWREVYQ